MFVRIVEKPKPVSCKGDVIMGLFSRLLDALQDRPKKHFVTSLVLFVVR
jgi:hypothetical protein